MLFLRIMMLHGCEHLLDPQVGAHPVAEERVCTGMNMFVYARLAVGYSKCWDMIGHVPMPACCGKVPVSIFSSRPSVKCWHPRGPSWKAGGEVIQQIFKLSCSRLPGVPSLISQEKIACLSEPNGMYVKLDNPSLWLFRPPACNISLHAK